MPPSWSRNGTDQWIFWKKIHNVLCEESVSAFGKKRQVSRSLDKRYIIFSTLFFFLSKTLFAPVYKRQCIYFWIMQFFCLILTLLSQCFLTSNCFCSSYILYIIILYKNEKYLFVDFFSCTLFCISSQMDDISTKPNNEHTMFSLHMSGGEFKRM